MLRIDDGDKLRSKVSKLCQVLVKQVTLAGAPPRRFDRRGGGRILVRQTHLPPKSDFSSGFGHFILKILKIYF